MSDEPQAEDQKPEGDAPAAPEQSTNEGEDTPSDPHAEPAAEPSEGEGEGGDAPAEQPES